MEAIYSLETSLNFKLTTMRYIPEDSSLQWHLSPKREYIFSEEIVTLIFRAARIMSHTYQLITLSKSWILISFLEGLSLNVLSEAFAHVLVLLASRQEGHFNMREHAYIICRIDSEHISTYIL
jgi:hypothetical protein